jgi:hypothetical protein
MRERDALRAAKRFVEKRYKYLARDDYHVEVALEHDGERARSWSFGVHPKDCPDDRGYVGYVHANGYVEGLY